MDRSATPCTINSFMSLAQQGWFNETRCHRLTDYGIFVLQCGDPTGTGTGGPGYTIPDELSPRTTGLEKEGTVATYPKGIVAMANTGKPHGWVTVLHRLGGQSAQSGIRSFRYCR